MPTDPPDETVPATPETPAAAASYRCAGCGRPLSEDDGEPTLALMRDGAIVASFHQRCHPHHRRSGCSRC